jgi:hypothetical protein
MGGFLRDFSVLVRSTGSVAGGLLVAGATV